MAIPKDLEPLVEGFTAEEKTLFDNLLTKQATTAKAKDPNAPTLADGWLRQSDYDRKMNLSKEEVKKAKERSQQLEDWYEENKPIHEAALSRAQELEARNAEITQQLEAARQARGAGGEDVDWAEVERRTKAEVEKYGYVTKTDIDKIIGETAGKSALEIAQKKIDEATKQYYEVAMPQGVNLAADIAEICVDHKAEFNERLDRKKFAEFMTERKLVDPVAAYTEYVKPRRDEVEFKKRVDEEVKQRISGLAINGGGPLPGSPMTKGAVQLRIDKDNAAAGNQLAAATASAAAELRNEGKF